MEPLTSTTYRNASCRPNLLKKHAQKLTYPEPAYGYPLDPYQGGETITKALEATRPRNNSNTHRIPPTGVGKTATGVAAGRGGGGHPKYLAPHPPPPPPLTLSPPPSDKPPPPPPPEPGGQTKCWSGYQLPCLGLDRPPIVSGIKGGADAPLLTTNPSPELRPVPTWAKHHAILSCAPTPTLPRMVRALPAPPHPATSTITITHPQTHPTTIPQDITSLLYYTQVLLTRP